MQCGKAENCNIFCNSDSNYPYVLSWNICLGTLNMLFPEYSEQNWNKNMKYKQNTEKMLCCLVCYVDRKMLASTWVFSTDVIFNLSVFNWRTFSMLICQLKRIMKKFFCWVRQFGCLPHYHVDLLRMCKNAQQFVVSVLVKQT